jgi:hypothetical protein
LVWNLIGALETILSLVQIVILFLDRFRSHIYLVSSWQPQLPSNRCSAITIHESIHGISQGRGSPRPPAANPATMP